jgi:nucleotide-binding universal stress UspA family protein
MSSSHTDTALTSHTEVTDGEGHKPGRIVVGVDGSACSIDALRWASTQAELTGATIDPVMSWDYPISSGLDFAGYDVDWAATAGTAIRTALALAFGSEAAIVGRVVRGRPADVLIAESAGADLLVVGSRGHGAMAGFLLGSVSERVVAHAQCPVVVVRHTETAQPHHRSARSADQPGTNERTLAAATQ